MTDISERVKRRAGALLDVPGNIISGLLSLISPDTKNTSYILKPPTEAIDLFDAIDKGVQRAAAETDAENIKLKQEVERLKEEKESNKYEEIQKLADDHFKKLRKDEQLRTLKLEIIDDPYPIWFLKNDRVYRELYLKGFRIYQTQDGYLLWYPWLIDKTGKEFVPVKGSQSFADLFRGGHIVTQLKGGKFDSNYFYDGYDMVLLPSKRLDSETGHTVNIFHLSEQERLEYENAIQQLKERLGHMYTEIQSLRTKEVGFITENIEKSLAADAQEKLADAAMTGLGVMAEKTATFGNQIIATLSSAQDSHIDRILAENALISMRNAVTGLQADLASAQRDIDSPTYKKVEERVNQILEMVSHMSTATTPPMQPIQGGGGV